LKFTLTYYFLVFSWIGSYLFSVQTCTI